MSYRSLITARQLRDKLCALKLLDAAPCPAQSSTLPLRVCDATVASSDPLTDYLDSHIPSATFFDLNECADRGSDLTRTVPSSSIFEEYVNSLGIGSSTEVVAYDATPSFGGLFSAPRLWWLFRLFGHDAVRVLDGGFDRWKREDRGEFPVASLTEQAPIPTPLPKEDAFRAKLRPNLLRTFEQMQEYVDDAATSSDIGQPTNLIDARSRRDHATAHIPTSKNLLFKTLVDPATGMLKSADELEAAFASMTDVNFSTPGFKFVTYCVTGTTACSLSLAAQAVSEARGVPIETAVYDGSMQEWIKRNGTIS